MSRPDASEPASFLPLTPLTFHILTALVDADLHGYGIIKELERRTGGRVPPSTGSVYLAIQRLEDDGLVEESSERPDPADDDSRRRYYRLTDLGRGVAEAEAERLAALLGLAREKRLIGAELLSGLVRPGGPDRAG